MLMSFERESKRGEGEEKRGRRETSSVWRFQSFFASQSLHNKKKFKKKCGDVNERKEEERETESERKKKREGERERKRGKKRSE